MYRVEMIDGTAGMRVLTESEVAIVGGAGVLSIISIAIEDIGRAAALISPTMNAIVTGADLLVGQ